MFIKLVKDNKWVFFNIVLTSWMGFVHFLRGNTDLALIWFWLAVFIHLDQVKVNKE